MAVCRLTFLAFSLSCGAFAQDFHVYVGHIEAKKVVLAWGHTNGGGNTIGRGSQSHGEAEVVVGDKRAKTKEAWVEISDLKPDTSYPYEVKLQGKSIGKGSVRTFPEKSDRLAFLVIGDWGTGQMPQYKIAEEMQKEVERRLSTDNPIRFVLTTGDNIYSSVVAIGAFSRNSGDSDTDWGSKFFVPYRGVLRHVPFYATLGNHDGNESERRADLTVYLDNFFFPGGKPARYYQFTYAGFADFFALDSSSNSEEGSRKPMYARNGEQHRWLQQQMKSSGAPWKIPFLHHPVHNAGPRHGSSYDDLKAFVEVFEQSGVKAVFSGHEHNLQFSAANAATKNILYVISGAGGQLRTGNVQGSMQRANIAAWAPQHNFLLVEIFGKQMRITPMSYEELRLINAKGERITQPFTVVLDKADERLVPSGN